MGYNPNEPRDSEGRWTNMDSTKAILEAATKKKKKKFIARFNGRKYEVLASSEQEAAKLLNIPGIELYLHEKK